MIKFIRTKIKKHNKYVYKTSINNKEIIVHYHLYHGCGGYWRAKLNDMDIAINGTLQGLRKELDEISIAQENVRLNGGWKCPNGCPIKEVKDTYSEFVNGYVFHRLNDKSLEDPHQRIEEESSDYEQDNNPMCPVCKGDVKYVEPLPNSVEYIKDMEKDK